METESYEWSKLMDNHKHFVMFSRLADHGLVFNSRFDDCPKYFATTISDPH
jgi:hypothetical protein